MRYFNCYLLAATRAFDRPFAYTGGELEDRLQVGQLVEVPFGRGNTLRRAVVAEVKDGDPGFKMKQIHKILNPEPLLIPEHFLLADEMRRRYFVSRGQALSAMMPQTVWQVGRKKALHARLKDPEDALLTLEEGGFRSLGQMRVVEFLLLEESASLEVIRINCSVSQAVLKNLEKKDVLEFYKDVVEREFEEQESLDVVPVERLNAEQEKIFEILKQPNDAFQEFLIHGITGSGKTEVFLRAAEVCLNRGETAIILVPEISLTPLMEARVKARFGDAAAILHSRLTAAERFENWRALALGEKRLAIGARSAIFAPLDNLGLIVLDEEQETSYKSDLSPRYDARDVARMRGHFNKAKVVLASATPSLETYWRTLSGKSQLLELTQRAGKAKLPEVHLVDLRDERAAGRDGLVSRPLEEAMRKAFHDGEQAMLFLNRRGHAHSVLCESCGQTLQCPDCAVALTEHLNPYAKRIQVPEGSDKPDRQMICHYCGRLFPPPVACPHCGSEDLLKKGIGTQQLEAYFNKHFAPYKALRMDFDTTFTRSSYHEILKAFSEGEASCLIGTQMIAKGHDFPNVTVVGIISADQLLATFDYRSEERCFQLITQAAGRAGRDAKRGEVYVQAYQTDNYAILSGMHQDYKRFMEEELRMRRHLHYPPFGEIGVILYQGLNEDAVRLAAADAHARLRRALAKAGWEDAIRLYQAQKAPIEKLRRRYRYRIILKTVDKEKLTRLLNWEIEQQVPKGVTRSFDINPNSMF